MEKGNFLTMSDFTANTSMKTVSIKSFIPLNWSYRNSFNKLGVDLMKAVIKTKIRSNNNNNNKAIVIIKMLVEIRDSKIIRITQI